MPCGLLVAAVALVWLGQAIVGLCILGGIAGGVACAAVIGVAIPNLLHRLELDPQVAAGPIALAACGHGDAFDLLQLGPVAVGMMPRFVPKREIQGKQRMGETSAEQVGQVVEAIYRSESRRVLATLIRLLGDFDLAEEALHEAFAAAVEQWPRDGVPANPRAWLVSTGRFRAVDAMRRRARLDASLAELANRLDEVATANAAKDEELEDDRLRLIFTCCHPALSSSTQVALTLREVCGLTTEEIASAFLTAPPTIAQRIVRGKAKIRDARIPYQVPSHRRTSPSGSTPCWRSFTSSSTKGTPPRRAGR